MRQSGMTGLIEKRSHDARKVGKIRKVYIDMDQSAREIHGHGHAVIETIIDASERAHEAIDISIALAAHTRALQSIRQPAYLKD
jgi:hypothetical protein